MKLANTVQIPVFDTLLKRLSQACDVPELQKSLFPSLLAQAGQTISLEKAGLLVLNTLGDYCKETPSLFPRVYELLGPELIRAIVTDDSLATVIIETAGKPFRD